MPQPVSQEMTITRASTACRYVGETSRVAVNNKGEDMLKLASCGCAGFWSLVHLHLRVSPDFHPPQLGQLSKQFTTQDRHWRFTRLKAASESQHVTRRSSARACRVHHGHRHFIHAQCLQNPVLYTVTQRIRCCVAIKNNLIKVVAQV